jgi:hypothetical protein
LLFMLSDATTTAAEATTATTVCRSAPADILHYVLGSTTTETVLNAMERALPVSLVGWSIREVLLLPVSVRRRRQLYTLITLIMLVWKNGILGRNPKTPAPTPATAVLRRRAGLK